MEMEAITIQDIFNPQFWKEKIPYGGCVHFVLNNLPLLLETIPHLNPRVMCFKDDCHYYLEIDDFDEERFIIDPERIRRSSSLFYVGKLLTCNHAKRDGYLTAVRDKEIEQSSRRGVRLEEAAMYW